MFQCFIVIVTCFLVSSCGKKGPVEPLEPGDYPRTYPKPPVPDSASMKKSNKVELS